MRSRKIGKTVYFVIYPFLIRVEFSTFPFLKVGCQGFVGSIPSTFLDNIFNYVKERALKRQRY